MINAGGIVNKEQYGFLYVQSNERLHETCFPEFHGFFFLPLWFQEKWLRFSVYLAVDYIFWIT